MEYFYHSSQFGTQLFVSRKVTLGYKNPVSSSQIELGQPQNGYYLLSNQTEWTKTHAFSNC